MINIITERAAANLAEYIFSEAKKQIADISDFEDRTGCVQLHKSAIIGRTLYVHIAKKCRYGHFVSIRINGQYTDIYGEYLDSCQSAHIVAAALNTVIENYKIS